MARKSRLLASLNNTPHLITQDHFNRVLQVLEARELHGKNYKMDGGEGEDGEDEEDCPLDGIGVPILKVDGPLTYKASSWQAMCGGTDYLSLERQMKQYAKDGAKAVVMAVSSGGGEAYGMMECADNLRAIADKNGMKIYGYAEGVAASAAYGLLCISDVVVANPSSSDIGNIGCVVRMIDTSEKDKMEGEKKVYIYAGGGKIPYAADGSFSEAYMADMQHKVDSMYDQFTSHVSKYRKIDKQVLIDEVQAKSYIAQDAVGNRLVDMLMTVDEFKTYIGKVSGSSMVAVNTNEQSGGYGMTQEANVAVAVEAALPAVNMSEVEQLKASALASKLQLETLQNKYNMAQERLNVLEAQVKEQAMLKRKEALSAALDGEEDKVNELMAATMTLNDDAFQKIVSTFKATSFVTKMSEEVGHGGGVETSHKEQSLNDLLLQVRSPK